jgi:hypothetical protein
MEPIKVLLEGGPTTLSESDRVHEVTGLPDRIRLPKGNGYEHFAYSGGSRNLNGASFAVYEWCHQTKIAE